MSVGSGVAETARLSAVVTWHLKSVRAWDAAASHSTLIAVYRLQEHSSESGAEEWSRLKVDPQHLYAFVLRRNKRAFCEGCTHSKSKPSLFPHQF